MKCPLCQKIFLDVMNGDTRYFYCSSCHLGRLKNIPKPDYSSDYYTASSTLARRAFIPIENLFYALRTRYAGKKSFDTWIDVGAGDGGYLKTVPAKKRIGVEVSSSGRERMKKKGIIPVSDTQYQKKLRLHADVLSFWHVLEHVTKPWESLIKARQLLKPGGKIIIAVPNIDSLEYTIFGTAWFHLVPSYHIWHFSIKSMTRLLGKVGLTIDRLDCWSIEHHLTGILQTFINATSGTEAALQKLVKRADGVNSMSALTVVASLFWMSIGAPFVFLFWILQVVIKRPGTFVLVVTKSTKYNKIFSTPNEVV